MTDDSTAGDDEQRAPTGTSTGRMEAFSDGVFAIAITLLVLELSPGRSGSALGRIVDAWPSYLAYLVSFATIGAAWLAHSALTDRLVKADSILLRINLLLLLLVSFVPYPTRLVAESLHDGAAERVNVGLYGIVLLLLRVVIHALNDYADREGLTAAARAATNATTDRIGVIVAAYAAAVLVGIAFPGVAVGLYCVFAFALLVPLGELRKSFTPRTGDQPPPPE